MGSHSYTVFSVEVPIKTWSIKPEKSFSVKGVIVEGKCRTALFQFIFQSSCNDAILGNKEYLSGFFCPGRKHIYDNVFKFYYCLLLSTIGLAYKQLDNEKYDQLEAEWQTNSLSLWDQPFF